MSKSTSYVIRYAGQYESALAACRCPIKTTRYESVVMAERDIAMVREGDTAALLAAQVSVRGDDGWYVYASQDDADADDDGSSAIAVIESSNAVAEARAAGVEWADREAGALVSTPSGGWLSSASDALPLVDGDQELAEICNRAARQRWDDIVETVEETES